MRQPRLRALFRSILKNLLRPLFLSLISSSFLKCCREIDEVTVTSRQGHTLISSKCDEVTVTQLSLIHI